MTLSRPEWQAALSEKQYVLGRREKTGGGVLTIGRYYALDGSLGAPVYLDALRPHVVFICGKRGYGKSYTIGVFLEEIASLEDDVKQSLGVVVVDTLGIYWATRFPTKEHPENLHRWGRSPEGFAVRLFVPEHAVEGYAKNDIATERFSLRVAELSPLHWCQLFDVKTTDPVGAVLTRAVLSLQSLSDNFSIAEILTCIKQDQRTSDVAKIAVENFFLMAESWGVFDTTGLLITDLVQSGTISVLDISHFQSPVLKDIVVSLVSEKIFEERVRARKLHEQKKMGFSVQEKGIPLVWLAIDEAQLFVPDGKKTLSKEVLINEWMRQGRQPGLSLIMATQRPSAVEPEVLSHSDILICHRLTAQEDIDALSRIRPTYMQGDISESLKKIGSEKGVAFLVDDTSESVHVIKVRPRVSWHGGAEPVIKEA
jgi:DNA helicase HerA-like ATPase